jgi:Icc-related predicted phosphoesterase
MRIIAISDTHRGHHHIELPPYQEGDVLVHAGDISGRGEIATIANFHYWLKDLPYQHMVVIAGNHDFCFENEQRDYAKTTLIGDQEDRIHYLKDSEITIDGIKFYGSPWQPWYGGWAFNLDRGEEIARKWELVPEDTDVLVTHGPPSSMLGGVEKRGKDVGCEDLFKRLKELKNLQYHICGHIHEGYGMRTHPDLSCRVINASIMDLKYNPTNKPFILPVK